MAIAKNGINGGFSGKVGSVIGYQWRGIDVMRSLPRPSKKKRTVAQLANQQKMKIVQEFLKNIIYFVRVGFKKEADERVMSAFNVAMSYNKKQAITGEYPDQRLDYAKVIVSNGGIAPVRDGSARWVAGGVEIRWKNNAGEAHADHNDYLLAVVYIPVGPATMFLFNGPRRDQETAFIPIGNADSEFIGQPAHVYTTFTAYDGSDVSPSTYLTVAES